MVVSKKGLQRCMTMYEISNLQTKASKRGDLGSQIISYKTTHLRKGNFELSPNGAIFGPRLYLPFRRSSST